MRRLIPVRVVTVLMLCVGLPLTASGAAIEKRGYMRGPLDALPCAIRVDFTSVAAGPDISAFDAMRRYIFDAADIYLAEAWSWGREGEFSLCLHIDDKAAAAKARDDLERLAPHPPNGTSGPTIVTSKP